MVGEISFGKFSRSVEFFKTKSFKKSKVHGDVKNTVKQGIKIF